MKKRDLLFGHKLMIGLFVLLCAISKTNAQVTVQGASYGNGDYSNLYLAFSELNKNTQGSTDDIVVKITGNITNQTATASLGHNNWHSLTIYPTLPNLTISGNVPGGAIINLAGADQVSIDGRVDGLGSTKSLTISNSATGASQAILLNGDACGNAIRYCNVKGSSSTLYNGIISITSGTSGNTNNLIDRCDISPNTSAYASCGISILGSVANSGNTISNSNIFDISSNVINTNPTAIFTATGSSATTISGNKIYWTSTVNAVANTYYGISTNGDLNRITENKIGFSHAEGTNVTTINSTTNTMFVGIRTAGGTSLANATVIEKDTIGNIDLNTNSTATATIGVFTGIYADASVANSYCKINNNYLHHINLKNNGNITTTGGLAIYWTFIGINVWTHFSNVRGNSITDLTQSSDLNTSLNKQIVRGIMIANPGGGDATAGPRSSVVANNLIHSIKSGSTSSGAANQSYGIAFAITAYDGDGGIVDNNMIYNIESENNSTSALMVGIQTYINPTYNYQAEGKDITVRNNTVRLGAGISSGGQIMGIYQNGNRPNCRLLLYHNSVCIGGNTSNSSALSYAFNRGLNNYSAIIKNNIFVNTRSGGLKNYIFKLASSTDYSTPYLSCNKNIYQYGTYFANIANIDQTTSNWQSYGFDANTNMSSQDPLFKGKDATPPNLHIENNSPAVGAGEDLSGVVAYDMDGESRVHAGIGQDIGADDISISSTPLVVSSMTVPGNKTYPIGSKMDFTVTYSHSIAVTGMPYIPVTLNTGGTVRAYYLSGTGSTTLTFRYTVQPGAKDNDGITVSNIVLNGGALRDGAGTDAPLTLSVPTTTGILVNGDAMASIYQLTVPANGTYKASSNLDFTATFNNDINVTGTPLIALNIGGNTVYASYLSGSGSSNLNFRYVVQPGDIDPDGIALASGSIIANGGTLKDPLNLSATLTLPAANLAGIIIDPTAPSVSSVAYSGTGTYGNGSKFLVRVTFSEPVSVGTGSAPQIALINPNYLYAFANASYVGKINESTLLFSASCDAVPFNDMVSINGNIDMPGGQITDYAGNVIIPTFTAPTTSSVYVNNTVNANSATSISSSSAKTYTQGQYIYLYVYYPSAVTVSGSPKIPLIVGSKQVNASFYSGSGTSTLAFRYTVAADDYDADGIEIEGYGGRYFIDTQNSSIKQNGTSNVVNYEISSVSLSGIKVDGSIITTTVSTVSRPANNTYGFGRNLDFTVNYTNTVTVNTTGGTPYINLTIGSTTRRAYYYSGSGTSSITFRYTVTTGDIDANGITYSSSIVLNSGTIQNSTNVNASTTLPYYSTAGVLVDYTLQAAISSFYKPANRTYVSGETLSFTVVYNSTVTVTGSPRLPLTIGSKSTYASFNTFDGNSTLTFTYTIAEGDYDGDGIAISSLDLPSGCTIKDAEGVDALLSLPSGTGTTTILVDASSPTITSVEAPANGTYKYGSGMYMKVTFSEPITVSNWAEGFAPRISVLFSTSNNVDYLNAVSMIGDRTILFRKTFNSVSPVYTDNDGITLGSTVELNGATITDAIGNNAIRTYTLPNTSGVLVNSALTAMYYSSISAPANGTYSVGQNLDFVVTYPSTVSVTGTPNIPVMIGSTKVYATYVSETASTNVRFRYTVSSGDTDANGIEFSNEYGEYMINPNGGAIQKASNNEAVSYLISQPDLSGVLVDNTIKVWLGTVSTDISDAANWSNGVPAFNESAVIAKEAIRQPEVTDLFACYNLTVLPGSSVTLNAGKRMNIYGNLYNQAGESGIVMNSDLTNTSSLKIAGNSTGNITVKRFMTGNAYHLISSPVSGQSISGFLTQTDNISFISTNTADGVTRGMTDYGNGGWNPYFNNSTTGNMSSGKGFLVRTKKNVGNKSLTMTGSVQTGELSIPVSAGWKCLGNPYTTAIFLNNAADPSFNILKQNNLHPENGAIYIWDETLQTPAYTIVNNATSTPAYAQVGQAFLIRFGSAGTITFTPNMQTVETGAAFRSASNTEWAEVKLSVSNSTDQYSTLIKFNDSMTKGLDATYDAGLFRSNDGFSVYTRLLDGSSNTDFGLQCVTLDEAAQMAIPVGVDYSTGGLVKFTASTLNIPDGYRIILEDREKSIKTNLSESGASYSVQLSANSKGTGRFFVYPQQITTGQNINPDNCISVYSLINELNVTGISVDQATATIYDYSGRAVQIYTLQKGNNRFGLTTGNGIYVVEIKAKNGSVLHRCKIVIR